MPISSCYLSAMECTTKHITSMELNISLSQCLHYINQSKVKPAMHTLSEDIRQY